VRSPVLYRQAVQAAFWVFLALVLYLALRPVTDQGGGIWDKALHFSAFYVLTALGAAAFARRALWTLAIGLVALGGAIELLQATPMINRDAEWGDLVADAIGVAAVLAPMLLLRMRTWLAAG
jgi:hypothetical protein